MHARFSSRGMCALEFLHFQTRPGASASMICRKKLIAADFSFCLGNTKRLRAMHEKDVFVERKLSHDRWWPVYIKSSQAWWRWWWRSGREVTSPLYHLNPNPRRRPACTYTLIDWFVHIYMKNPFNDIQWHLRDWLQISMAFRELTPYISFLVYIYTPPPQNIIFQTFSH